MHIQLEWITLVYTLVDNTRILWVLLIRKYLHWWWPQWEIAAGLSLRMYLTHLNWPHYQHSVHNYQCMSSDFTLCVSICNYSHNSNNFWVVNWREMHVFRYLENIIWCVNIHNFLPRALTGAERMHLLKTCSWHIINGYQSIWRIQALEPTNLFSFVFLK